MSRPPVVISVSAQIAEVERELAMRRRKYPEWVAKTLLSEQEAAKRLARLEAVLETLRTHLRREELPL